MILQDAAQNFEKLKFVFDSLKDVSNMYAEFSFTTTASILLVVGWILTSDKLRTFTEGKAILRVAFIGVIFLIFSTEIYLACVFYHNSKELYTSIGTFASGIPEIAYEYKRIDLNTVYLFTSVHFLMYCFLGYLVWIISSKTQPIKKLKKTESSEQSAGKAT